VFYAQSVALVDYLTNLKGPQVFTTFVREALRDGYDAALRKHYGFQTFGEFQDRFTERMVAEANGKAPAYAER
jgi:arginine/ornithine N-succinyltransferase beta subunit